MDEISLEQLEEMQKDLLKQQCDLDIRKVFVKHFIKNKQTEQLTIPVVVKSYCKHCGNELCDSQTFNNTCFNCGKKPI